MIIWTKTKLPIELVKRDQYQLWLKINISTSQPVFLCAIYIPPLESPYFQEETFQNIEQEFSHLQDLGNVLTGDKSDFIESQGTRFVTGINTFFPSHPPRQNCDQTGNSHGRQLLQLCQNPALYIVNHIAFTVKPLKPFSDHSQITLYIKQSETVPSPISTPYQMHKMLFKWTENSTTNYINAIESSEIQSLLHSFQIQEYLKN
ncbi:hypothetical protein H4Q32_022882 [Labeo rohita]|uniref:Endonuclease/exonuclease/phosphatase domain-containing protein n=1 Tax=Labeo rohita TaxID=84645 RepID=A0ABQ8MSG4_LABRO|nr:hypothetical protein H4Q32_022882 [Labeo rohita]